MIHAAGFVGDRCEIEVNFCSDQPCESGTCISTSEGYYCQCPPGIIGRRCTLRPCDYVPCHENAICIDLMEHPASRSRYNFILSSIKEWAPYRYQSYSPNLLLFYVKFCVSLSEGFARLRLFAN